MPPTNSVPTAQGVIYSTRPESGTVAGERGTGLTAMLLMTQQQSASQCCRHKRRPLLHGVTVQIRWKYANKGIMSIARLSGTKWL